MITITATGFIGDKPELLMVGANSQKCEFDVVWNRRTRIGGEWKTNWERATFVAWGEEAEHIASIVEKGNTLSCTGLQETSTYEDNTGQKRRKTRYYLTAWIKHPAPQARQHDGDQPMRQPDPVPSQQRPSQPARPPAGQYQGDGYSEREGRNGERPMHQPQSQHRHAQNHPPYRDDGHSAERNQTDYRNSGFDSIEM